MKTLRSYREEAGLTQAQLAARVGVTQGTVARWEEGSAVPRPRHIKAIEIETSGIVTASSFYANSSHSDTTSGCAQPQPMVATRKDDT